MCLLCVLASFFFSFAAASSASVQHHLTIFVLAGALSAAYANLEALICSGMPLLCLLLSKSSHLFMYKIFRWLHAYMLYLPSLNRF